MITPSQTIREQIESRERATLSAHAALAAESRGRATPEEPDRNRTAFQRDRDRILHTKSFRRLKRKTQVFLAPVGDHFRTRLTHTLEVAQIARTVARALFLNEDLTEAIALGHDLGHTPFGHAGERVLDDMYAPGFQHAEQSLRVVDVLERRSGGRGLNLTHEVREGILYHSKGKAVLEDKAAEPPPTLEAMIVSLCDALAYISHDIDDALRAHVIVPEELPRDAVAVLGEATSERIDRMVVGVIEGSDGDRIAPLPEVREAMQTLRNYLYAEVYPRDAIRVEILKAENVLRELYRQILAQPTEDILEADPADSLERRVVDFVASMTDEYALRLFEELLLPAPWRR